MLSGMGPHRQAPICYGLSDRGLVEDDAGTNSSASAASPAGGQDTFLGLGQHTT